MTYRATRTEVNEVFNLFCKAIGKRVAETWNDAEAMDPRLRKITRRLRDYQIIHERGARETPLGDQRNTPTERVERMRFALRWLEHKDHNND